MSVLRMIYQQLTQLRATQSDTDQLPLQSINTGVQGGVGAPLHAGETKGKGLKFTGGVGLSPGSSSSKLWIKVFPKVPTRLCCLSWLPACWDGTRSLHPGGGGGGHVKLPGCPGTLGFIRVATVRSLAHRCRWTNLPWGQTLDNSFSWSYGFLRGYFKCNSAYRLASSTGWA